MQACACVFAVVRASAKILTTVRQQYVTQLNAFTHANNSHILSFGALGNWVKWYF